jgi:hypothetical protein
MTSPTTRIAALAVSFTLLVSAAAVAQELPELVGPARDVARSTLIDPVILDPLIAMPLTSTPQAMLDIHGGDVAAAFNAGVRTGDNNYGFTVSLPLAQSDATTVMDAARMRKHAALGFHINNMIWHPKATPGLERELGSGGVLRLSKESREAVARSLKTADGAVVPWVLFVHGGYAFSRGEYSYFDTRTSASKTDSHLTDNGTLLFGSQLFIRPDDFGYFVAFSYTYFSIFRDADPVNGVRIEGPIRTKGNLLRFELRRLFPSGRVGINPSFSVEDTTNAKAVETMAYLVMPPESRWQRWASASVYVGARVGYETNGKGLYASVFVGPVFGGRP